MNKGWTGFLIFVRLIPAGIWSAFVAATIWRWFAVPIGMPDLSVVRIMGLSILIGMHKYTGPADEKASEGKTGGELFGVL